MKVETSGSIDGIARCFDLCVIGLYKSRETFACSSFHGVVG